MAENTTAGGKKERVESMFDSIAWRYDFLNHFLSLGIDRLWRKRTVRIVGAYSSDADILDVATGTADLAIEAMRIGPRSVTGIDISKNMLEIGRRKIRQKGYQDKIRLLEADSENIPFPDSCFDAAMVAFGVRNFSDPLKGLAEMNRVLKPEGLIVVLEFSKPTSFFFSKIYRFYFLNILPFFGKLFSKDKSAYRYLPESVMKFPDNEEFLDLLKTAGFGSTRQVKLTGGIASIYTGIKRGAQ